MGKRKLAPLSMNSRAPQMIDHATTIGCVEVLDGSMNARTLYEVFDQVAHRRNAGDHVYQMDHHVRRYLANLLREHMPRKREAQTA